MREEVTILLRKKILKGEIGQGERLKETELAEEFGVSRGPIREAFRELQQEGLVSYSSRKGCTVKFISATDSAEVYILRTNLENLAMRMCKGKFREETIHKMEQIVKEMENYNNSDDLLEVIELDQRFHELIVRECESNKLYEMWASLNSVNAIIFYALYHSRYAPDEQLANNHKMVLDAIKTEKIDQMCSELQEHYLIVSKNLCKEEEIDLDFDIVL